MNVVSTHGVDAVGLPIDYGLVVEEEFISPQELSLASAQFVGNHAILENM